jgi:large subunit ribosomal protein L32
MAVPKKKTSPSRRRMRSASKHVSFDTMVPCHNCGALRRHHHMCTECGFYKGRHVKVMRSQKRMQKAQESDKA